MAPSAARLRPGAYVAVPRGMVFCTAPLFACLGPMESLLALGVVYGIPFLSGAFVVGLIAVKIARGIGGRVDEKAEVARLEVETELRRWLEQWESAR